MTDLRGALIEACDIADLALLDVAAAPIRRIVEDRADVARLRSLATSPLTVLDALRDPEVRAGRVWVEAEHHEAMWQYRIDDGDLEPFALRRIRLRSGWGSWDPCSLGISVLDSPCRLVPAEEAP